MESPAPTEFTTLPRGAAERSTSPFSLTRTAPSPAMETSTFLAPRSCRRRASGTASSAVWTSWPKMAPSSWLLGLMRKGPYGRASSSRSRSASTTVRTPRPATRASMRWYMSCGTVAGTLPASTRKSPSPSPSRRCSREARSFSPTSGPMPFISLSSRACTFTLTRVRPWSRRTKSQSTPRSASMRSTSAPVKPATKPSAREGWPRFLSTTDTLMPLPPGSMSSVRTRLTSPSARLSRLTT